MNETVQAEITKETTTWRKSRVAMLSLCLILLVAVAISVGLVVAGGDDGVTTRFTISLIFCRSMGVSQRFLVAFAL
jgi:hypothetical protein